jgi:hypothetical protein
VNLAVTALEAALPEEFPRQLAPAYVDELLSAFRE